MTHFGKDSKSFNVGKELLRYAPALLRKKKKHKFKVKERRGSCVKDLSRCIGNMSLEGGEQGARKEGEEEEAAAAAEEEERRRAGRRGGAAAAKAAAGGREIQVTSCRVRRLAASSLVQAIARSKLLRDQRLHRMDMDSICEGMGSACTVSGVAKEEEEAGQLVIVEDLAKNVRDLIIRDGDLVSLGGEKKLGGHVKRRTGRRKI